MRRYLLVICLILGLAVYVARENQKHSDVATHQSEKKVDDPAIPKTGTTQTQDDKQATEWHPPSWYSFFTWPDGVTALVLITTLFAVVEQAVQTARAAEATEQSVTTANQSLVLQEDTAKRQLRAYICVTASRVRIGEEGSLEAHIFFKNGGQTPAYDVRSWSFPLAEGYPLTYNLGIPPPELPMAVGIIPSKEKQITVAVPIVLRPPDIGRLCNRDFAFYVTGEVNYSDIFGERHILKYRLVFGGPAGTKVAKDKHGVEWGALCMDREGNEEIDIQKPKQVKT